MRARAVAAKRKSGPAVHLRGAAAVLWAIAPAFAACAQSGDVTLRATVTHEQRESHNDRNNTSGNIVAWLTPVQKDVQPMHSQRSLQGYTLTQKDKQFYPHILVVPTGSSVDFPNLDPFFHNVFSLFNGKRFDLGLYEAHTRKTVHFDREGVSYIFCNIHPEMAAVIVSLSTPYYGVSSSDGLIVMHNVPPGSYILSVWAENVLADSLTRLSHVVEVNARTTQLGTLSLRTSGDIMVHHQNKFGESYATPARDPY